MTEHKLTEIPYSQILQDMSIDDIENQLDFMDTILLCAENCYGICNTNTDSNLEEKSSDFEEKSKENDEKQKILQGSFDWHSKQFADKPLTPIKHFKINFTYFHSEDLKMRIESVELLTPN
jgi:hypothetical protein